MENQEQAFKFETELLKDIAKYTQQINPLMHDPIEDDYYHTTRNFSYYDIIPIRTLGKDLENVLKEKRLLLREPLRILDIGCGVGNCVKDLLCKGYDAFGIDVIHYKNNIGDHFIVGDMEKADKLIEDNNKIISIPNNIFHVIISMHSMYHMKNQDKVIMQTYRMLKKNGIALLDNCVLNEHEKDNLRKNLDIKMDSSLILLRK